jgi:hypothetical protein
VGYFSTHSGSEVRQNRRHVAPQLLPLTLATEEVVGHYVVRTWIVSEEDFEEHSGVYSKRLEGRVVDWPLSEYASAQRPGEGEEHPRLVMKMLGR